MISVFLSFAPLLRLSCLFGFFPQWIADSIVVGFWPFPSKISISPLAGHSPYAENIIYFLRLNGGFSSTAIIEEKFEKIGSRFLWSGGKRKKTFFFQIIFAVKLLTTPIWKSDLTIDRENVTTAFLDECFVLYNFWTFDPVLKFTIWMSHSKSIYHLCELILPIYFRAQNHAPRRNLIVGNGQILAEVWSLKGVQCQTSGSVRKFS